MAAVFLVGGVLLVLFNRRLGWSNSDANPFTSTWPDAVRRRQAHVLAVLVGTMWAVGGIFLTTLPSAQKWWLFAGLCLCLAVVLWMTRRLQQHDGRPSAGSYSPR